MSNLRRYFRPNDTVFLTCVTAGRTPILIENSDLIHLSIETVRAKTPFTLLAWVIMDDHIHLIISDSSSDPSNIIRNIKLSFSARYRKRHLIKTGLVWQHRFWDHIIRDQDDLNRHIDYIHFNAVKHGFVKRAVDWKHSSLHEFIAQGYYSDLRKMEQEFEEDEIFGE